MTIATSSGAVHLALLAHLATGLLGLGTGFVALAVAKGSLMHRRSGMVFVYAMLATALLATGIATYEGKVSMMISAPFTAYLIFTAMTAVRPLNPEPRLLAPVLMMLAFAWSVADVTMGVRASARPHGMMDGVPAGMFFFLGTIALLAGVGDLRMIRAGGIQGSRRIARHLWRMCFGLFVASGSFLLGQAKFIPKPVRIPLLLNVAAVAPLIALIYWMWRVRLRNNLRGIVHKNAVRAEV
jgi:uncharacterized membrane protein